MKKERYLLCLLAIVALQACSKTQPLLDEQDAGPWTPDNDTNMDLDVDTNSDTETDTDVDVNLTWVPIVGGTFNMGSVHGQAREKPVHSVTLPSFEMTRTEVTVSQYRTCVNSSVCTSVGDFASCNWGVTGRENHPVNCVAWQQAVDFCTWTGGRLPSEAEWEYAARSGGQDITYPWGNLPISCEYAVMYGKKSGCGMGSTMKVCSKPRGNTYQGLCDMAGNLWEWVRDLYHNDYTGAPTDGSAWEDQGNRRVVRGGSWYFNDPDNLRTTSRDWNYPTFRYYYNGFRCAR
ncbi:MAG: formylglycine-generating enzyme family protein [Proteobacteria bacterium]|nr:formylglycine-generating enzyme family protein [Pseudomonadota bacterium]